MRGQYPHVQWVTCSKWLQIPNFQLVLCCVLLPQIYKNLYLCNNFRHKNANRVPFFISEAFEALAEPLGSQRSKTEKKTKKVKWSDTCTKDIPPHLWSCLTEMSLPNLFVRQAHMGGVLERMGRRANEQTGKQADGQTQEFSPNTRVLFLIPTWGGGIGADGQRSRRADSRVPPIHGYYF